MSYLSLATSTADYSVLTRVDELQVLVSWERWAELTLESVGKEVSIDGVYEDMLLCTVRTEVEVAVKAKPTVVRTGYVYALGLACAAPFGFMPVVGVLLWGTACACLHETTKPDTEEEYYNEVLNSVAD